MPMDSELKPVIPEPGRPLFQSVKETVRAAVDAGRFPPGEKIPSTKAISEQLNVSLVTVHRALQELVAAGVLRRGQGHGTFVHEGYAQRAGRAKGQRIGLVFHDEASLADFFHGHVLEGVRRGTEEYGADLVLLHFGEDWRNECHGFIYVNPMQAQLERSPWFEGVGVNKQASRKPRPIPPVVVVGASFDRQHVTSIDTDNADIAVQAVRHLASLGHRKIGYVGGDFGVSNSLDRWRGFSEACTSLGLPTPAEWVIRSPGWKLDERERAALATMLRAPNRPTAILAAGYYFALDVYTAAAAAGLNIPRDLSVVGVDDPPSAEHLSPRLTTLRQPLEQMGRIAAKLLLDNLSPSGDAISNEGRGTMLRAELVIRQSTGPVMG